MSVYKKESMTLKQAKKLINDPNIYVRTAARSYDDYVKLENKFWYDRREGNTDHPNRPKGGHTPDDIEQLVENTKINNRMKVSVTYGNKDEVLEHQKKAEERTEQRKKKQRELESNFSFDFSYTVTSKNDLSTNSYYYAVDAENMIVKRRYERTSPTYYEIDQDDLREHEARYAQTLS